MGPKNAIPLLLIKKIKCSSQEDQVNGNFYQINNKGNQDKRKIDLWKQERKAPTSKILCFTVII